MRTVPIEHFAQAIDAAAQLHEAREVAKEEISKLRLNRHGTVSVKRALDVLEKARGTARLPPSGHLHSCCDVILV